MKNEALANEIERLISRIDQEKHPDWTWVDQWLLENPLGREWSREFEELARIQASRVKAALRANAAPQGERTSPSGLWMVYYEDRGVPPEIFFGDGAEAGARKRYASRKLKWSCHLLSRVPDSSPAAGHAEGGGDTQVVPKMLPDKAYSAGMNYLAKYFSRR